MGAKQDQETVAALQRETQELEQELRSQVSDITARWEEATTKFEPLAIRPKRNDVRVDLLALAWTPHWQIRYRRQDGSAYNEMVPAYA